MKATKILLLIFFLSGISSSVFSQAQFSLGIKGGLNFANIDASSLGETYENRTGYNFGAFGLFKFTKIGIQPELLFSQQGTKVKLDGSDFESNFSYINIPIVLKLYTIGGLNLQAGPQFGFLSSADWDGADVKDFLKGSDFSLALGVGWDLPFGLTIDARYNLGLSDINDSPAYDEIKNKVWQVSLGYKLFNFGK